MKARLLALLCALLLTLSLVPTSAALEGDALRAADTLATLNIVRGNGSGYALSSPATRAHAAVLLVRLTGSQHQALHSGSCGLQDIPAWCGDEVGYCLFRGWLPGVDNFRFSPDEAISGDDWCAALLRVLGYTDEEFDAGAAARFAQHIGLTARLYTGPLTRGQLFETALGALIFPRKDSTRLIDELVDRGLAARSTVSALGLMEEHLTLRQVTDRHMAAVFQLDCYETKHYYDIGLYFSSASGFFVTEDGLAVTNYHSIQGAPYAGVTLSTGEVYPVKSVLWWDEGMDLALIRVDMISKDNVTASSFAHLELVSSEEVRPGDEVYAIGNPLGLGLAASQGVVCAVDRIVPGHLLPCIVNTADISHGSSGGALMNSAGHVFGVTTGAYTNGNNLYLALPVDILLEQDWTVKGQPLPEVAAIEAALRPNRK